MPVSEFDFNIFFDRERLLTKLKDLEREVMLYAKHFSQEQKENLINFLKEEEQWKNYYF